ncbi:TPA: hypothetical protein ACGQ50_003851 [Enterobacter cloacae]
MFVFLVIPILVSGFFIIQIHPIFKYKLHRYEGQFLYLKSAQYGLYSLIIAIIFTTYFSGSVNIPKLNLNINIIELLQKKINFITSINNDKKTLDELSIIFLITIYTLIVPFIWAFFSYIRLFIKYRAISTKPYVMSQIFQDSPLDKFLFNASVSKNKDEAIVMLTMQDKKVYVGNVITMGEPNETEGPDQEIEFVPWMSGYRDKDTLNVTFTTDYKILNQKVTLILRQDEILSATSFSIKHYEEFEKRKENANKSTTKEIIKAILKVLS